MKTAWKAFCSNPVLLANLGSDDLHDETRKLAEKFVYRMYTLSDEDRFDNAQAVMFGKCILSESLPLTCNALQLHVQRACYQSMAWI